MKKFNAKPLEIRVGVDPTSQDDEHHFDMQRQAPNMKTR
jgi:hypothetical protein